MSDLNFEKVIEKLQEIHKELPDLRFGQIIQTALDTCCKYKNVDLHDYNSKEILHALEEFHTHNCKCRAEQEAKKLRRIKLREAEKENIKKNKELINSKEEHKRHDVDV